MNNKEKQYFLNFFLHSKALTRAQKKKRDLLIARDCSTIGGASNETPAVSASDSTEHEKCTQHYPQTVVAFLHQFTESKKLALKYTTHLWDRDVEGKYPYKDFDEFKDKYMEILRGDRPLGGIYELNLHLWKIVKNFLLDKDGYEWSQYKLTIGYNQYLKDWMDKHPNMQPFDMPISDFPEKMQPKSLVKGKTLLYFSDVVDIFKHCIEFRDNDLFFSVRKIFKESPDHRLGVEQLSTLRGRSFYTDTEEIIVALKIIAQNIFQRSAYPELQISCKLIEKDSNEAIQLRILQIGSFSDKDVKDAKLSGNDGLGDLSRIKTTLKNLCDFSVESRFRVNEELRSCRINYLSSMNPLPNKIEFIDDEQCQGFTYILTFYSYKHE